MNVLWTLILDGLKKHGVVFLILMLMILYFQQQVEKMETKFDICNTKMMQMYESNEKTLIQALERNTNALESLAQKK
jgi:hypothetical protein